MAASSKTVRTSDNARMKAPAAAGVRCACPSKTPSD
jgi:hypothetical protein